LVYQSINSDDLNRYPAQAERVSDPRATVIDHADLHQLCVTTAYFAVFNICGKRGV